MNEQLASAITEIKKYSRYSDGQPTHTLAIEDHYDDIHRGADRRFEVHAKTGIAAGEFYKNGGHELFETSSIEDAVERISFTLGLKNILIISI